MTIFSIVAGMASIISLLMSILALKGVHDVKIQIGFTNKSRTRINQKARGNDIRQAGGNMNV